MKTKTPICPYCKEKVYPDEYTIGFAVNENFHNKEQLYEMCPHCEKDFKIRVYLSVEYTTKKMKQTEDGPDVYPENLNGFGLGLIREDDH